MKPLAPGPSQDVAAFLHGERRFALTPIAGGFAVTVSGSDEQYAYTQDIRAALPSTDDTLYLFAVDGYIVVNPADDQRRRHRQCARSLGIPLRSHCRPLGLRTERNHRGRRGHGRLR